MATINKTPRFAICVANEGYDDLEIRKMYPVLPDAKAAGLGCLRVVDESGEDYLYPANRFVVVDLPKSSRARLPNWPDQAMPVVTKRKRRLVA